jgi:hypothetical protein
MCPPPGATLFFGYFLLGGMQKKVSRGAGRSARGLAVDLQSGQVQYIKFAGPGRQPGDFLCWSKESNQRKDLRLAAGTSVAESRLLLPPVTATENRCVSARPTCEPGQMVQSVFVAVANTGTAGSVKANLTLGTRRRQPGKSFDA